MVRTKCPSTVGTFDEALKSRLQLVIHFPKLNRAMRRRLWENFVQELQEECNVNRDLDVSIGDLQAHLDDLSELELNGRQVDNAIRTARQLALDRRKTLTSEYIKLALKVVGNNYLEMVNGR